MVFYTELILCELKFVNPKFNIKSRKKYPLALIKFVHIIFIN